MPGPLPPSESVPPIGAPGSAPTPATQIGAGVVAAGANGLAMGTVGPEIPPITIGINAIVEQLKHWEKFNEKYAFHYVVALWAIVSVTWGFIKGDPTHSILMLFGGIGNSHFTHEGIKGTGTGIVKPVSPEKQYVPAEGASIRPLVLMLTLGALAVIVVAVVVVAILISRL